MDVFRTERLRAREMSLDDLDFIASLLAAARATRDHAFFVLGHLA